jgi:hypothetical protein
MALKPSLRLASLLLLSHLLVACVVFQIALPVSARTALFPLIVLSLGYYLARDALLLFPGSWCELSFDSGGISVVNRDGSRFTGKVANGSMICPYFIALGVRSEARRLPVFRVLFPDAMGREEFRELCVRLRFS